MHSEKVGAFRTNQFFEKVGTFRANRTQKRGGFTEAHTGTRTAFIWEYLLQVFHSVQLV